MAKKRNLGGRPRSNPKPKRFDRVVGGRIHERRLALKMAPGDFAKKIGRSLSQVYRLESGDSPVKGDLFPKIAEVLGCQVSDLVDGTKAPK